RVVRGRISRSIRIRVRIMYQLFGIIARYGMPARLLLPSELSSFQFQGKLFVRLVLALTIPGTPIKTQTSIKTRLPVKIKGNRGIALFQVITILMLDWQQIKPALIIPGFVFLDRHTL